jgi:hypothetical protein
MDLSMTRLLRFACLALLVLGTVPSVRAQDSGDVAAYLALLFTPVGALPPQVTPAMAGLTQTRTRARVQYGRVGDLDANNLGFGLDFGRDRGSAGLTLGVGFRDCDGCDEVVMVGAHLEGVLGSKPISTSTPDVRLNVGLRGDVGFARADETTALSAVVGAPVSVSAPAGELRFVPFLTPGFGFGRVSNGDSDSGIRFLLGGGIGVVGAGGLMLDIAFQKVFIKHGDTQVGVGVAWNIGH